MYLVEAENCKDPVKLIQSRDIKQAVDIVARCWSEVSLGLIANCFRHALFVKPDSADAAVPPRLSSRVEDPDVVLPRNVWDSIQVNLSFSLEFEEYAEGDCVKDPNQPLTDDDIMRHICEMNTSPEDLPEGEDPDVMDDEGNIVEQPAAPVILDFHTFLSTIAHQRAFLQKHDMPKAQELLDSLEKELIQGKSRALKQGSLDCFFSVRTLPAHVCGSPPPVCIDLCEDEPAVEAEDASSGFGSVCASSQSSLSTFFQTLSTPSASQGPHVHSIQSWHHLFLLKDCPHKRRYLMQFNCTWYIFLTPALCASSSVHTLKAMLHSDIFFLFAALFLLLLNKTNTK